MSATPTVTFTWATSPAAHLDLPTEFTLGKVRTWRAREGQGVEAELKYNGNIIGTVGHEGHGDGTYYRPSVPFAEGRAVADAVVAEYKQRPSLEYSEFLAEECLWDNLLEEHETRKTLDRLTKGTKKTPGKTAVIKDTTPRVRVGDEDFSYTEVQWYEVRVPVAHVRDRKLEVVLNNLRNDGIVAYWDGEKWATI